MAQANVDNAEAQQLKDFLAKRGARMLEMASQLASAAADDDGAEAATATTGQPAGLPSLKQVLELIDGLGIDVEDKLKLRQRILNRAVAEDLVDSVVERRQVIGGGEGGENGDGDWLMSIASGYEFYLFALTAGLVVSVFGKRMIWLLTMLSTWAVCSDDVELCAENVASTTTQLSLQIVYAQIFMCRSSVCTVGPETRNKMCTGFHSRT